MNRFTPIHCEWNNINGFFIEILYLEFWEFDGCLFGFEVARNFFNIHILFFYIEIKAPFRIGNVLNQRIKQRTNGN